MRFINVEIWKLLPRITLAQSHSTNFGSCKNGACYKIIVHGGWLAAKDLVGKSMSFTDCNGRKINPIGDIADGVVIASEIIRRIGDAPDPAAADAMVEQFGAGISAALRA